MQRSGEISNAKIRSEGNQHLFFIFLLQWLSEAVKMCFFCKRCIFCGFDFAKVRCTRNFYPISIWTSPWFHFCVKLRCCRNYKPTNWKKYVSHFVNINFWMRVITDINWRLNWKMLVKLGCIAALTACKGNFKSPFAR